MVKLSKRRRKNKGFTCKKRKNYRSYGDAVEAAEKHNKRVLFAGMHAYFCRRHQYWHIGHSDKHRLSM